MQRHEIHFPESLESIEFASLEYNPESVFALNQDLELIYFNPGWVYFAYTNGGTNKDMFELGNCILDNIQGKEIRDFYRIKYNEVLKTGLSWDHEYECSSPDDFRIFHQRTIRSQDGTRLIVIAHKLEKYSMLLSNRVKAKNIKEENYIQQNNRIEHCGNCRMTKRANAIESWEWIPKWIVKAPKNIHHTICPSCRSNYQ